MATSQNHNNNNGEESESEEDEFKLTISTTKVFIMCTEYVTMKLLALYMIIKTINMFQNQNKRMPG